MKRARDDGGVAAAHQHIVENSDTDKVVRNSPYGAERSALGWGTPFKPAARCILPECPQLHIGLSSLNAVPGKDREMKTLLGNYCKKFDTLEHCNPYHRMGEVSNWEQWRAMPGEKRPFLFTIKANKYFTHTRLLEIDADTVDHIENFFEIRCKGVLGDRLGAVLLQLPPQFHNTPAHLDRVRAVGAQMPSGLPVAIEFRHRSWYTEEVYGVLRGLRWALVVTHNHDVGTTPIVDTGADVMYVRLHGAVQQYGGDYGPAAMGMWAEKVIAHLRTKPESRVFFFFNNNETHIGGLTSSVADATQLAIAVKRALSATGAASPSKSIAAHHQAACDDSPGPLRPRGPADASDSVVASAGPLPSKACAPPPATVMRPSRDSPPQHGVKFEAIE